MRIYLAGPMRGYPDENREAFARETARMRELGHTVFNPVENKTDDLKTGLAIDTAWICLSSQMIAKLPGWGKSLGAQAEVALADAIGIPHMPVEMVTWRVEEEEGFIDNLSSDIIRGKHGNINPE